MKQRIFNIALGLCKKNDDLLKIEKNRKKRIKYMDKRFFWMRIALKFRPKNDITKNQVKELLKNW